MQNSKYIFYAISIILFYFTFIPSNKNILVSYTFIGVLIVSIFILLYINLHIIVNIINSIRVNFMHFLVSIKRELLIITIYAGFFHLFLYYPLGYVFYFYSFIVMILFIYFIYLLWCLGLNFSFLFVLVLVLSLISFVFYFLPLIMLVILSVAGLFSVIFSCFYKDFVRMSSTLYNKFYSKRIIKFLILLDYNLFYNTENENKFDSFCNLLLFFSLNYILFAKIYVIFSVKPNFNNISSFNYKLLSFVILICLFVYLLKSFINLCRLLSIGYQQSFILCPDLPDIPPEVASQNNSSSSSVTTYRGFFNRHTHTHYHTYSRRIPRFFTLNRTIGICTLGLGCVGVYYTKITYDQSVEQTRQAQEQTREMKRMNDLSELSQGIITKEEYAQRHSPISLPSYYESYEFKFYFIYYVILFVNQFLIYIFFTLIPLILIFVSSIIYFILIYRYFYHNRGALFMLIYLNKDTRI